MAKHADRIRELLQDGWSYSRIAQELGCSIGTISFHAKKMGKGTGPRTKHDWEVIRDWYSQGHSRMECLNRFGISKQSWAAAVRRGDIAPRARQPRTREEYNAHMRAYMLDRYHRVRNEMVSYLGGRCNHCGSTEGLEIDHVDRTKKTMRTERMAYVKEARREEELQRCQLLCRPCHQEKTLKDLGWKRRKKLPKGP